MTQDDAIAAETEDARDHARPPVDADPKQEARPSPVAASRPSTRRRPTAPGGSSPPLEGELHIAVDVDGVLFDHVPYVLRGFRDVHGIDLTEEGLQYWDFFQYQAVREKGLTWRCVRNVLDEIETDPVLHQKPPKDPRCQDVMAAWQAAGHRVDVVTARSGISRKVTELFLETHGIPHEELVMEASRKTGYDVLIDDSPHNVLMAAADGSVALLMDQPYNQDVPAENNPWRVADWRQVRRLVPPTPVATPRLDA